MILFYSPGTCSLAAIVLLQWLEEPHRLCRVSREERKGPVFRRAINEHGQVPALLRSGRVLTENAAILLLLADLRPQADLVPEAGSPDRYEMYRWLSWLDSGFHSAHAPMFAPQRFVPDESLHDVVRAHALETIQEQVAVLDRHLEDRDHVLFEKRNLLDPYVFAMARWCEEKLDYAHAFPNLARFLDSMREDEGIRTGLAIEAGDILSGGSLHGHVEMTQLVDADGQLVPTTAL